MKNYVNESLMPNEQVTARAEISKIFYIPSIVVLGFAVIGAFVSGSAENFFGMIIDGIFLAAIMLLPFLKYFFCELAVTNKKICGKKGIIKTTEMNSPLRQIQNVQVNSGLIGKIFDFGKITITTTTGVYRFKYIYKANDFKKAVMIQIENTEEDKMNLNAQKIANAINDKT